jgi:hypothetical protein
MITFTHKGDFNKTTKFLEKNLSPNYLDILYKYGNIGIDLLSSATPTRTGETANSWYFDIEDKNSNLKLIFYNSKMIEGVPLVILLQYGHGTRNGGYVEGIDFINPTLKPLFDQITNDIWKEVVR